MFVGMVLFANKLLPVAHLDVTGWGRILDRTVAEPIITVEMTESKLTAQQLCFGYVELRY